MKIFKIYCMIITFLAGLLGSFSSNTAVIVNDITQLNPIAVHQIVTPKSTYEVSQLVANYSGPISIGGGQYSQGGQIAIENCLFLDMRSMNRIINLNTVKLQITVEAGATWRKIQEAIDLEGLSIKIMQSFSNFTVGGSLSVNAHGRYVNEGPIIRSVESIKIVLADGSIKEASRTINSDLFFGAIGGYGGIGVITEATLNLTENTHVKRISKKMDISDYKKYFFHNIRFSKSATFHNADFYPPDYKQVNAVTWNKTNQPVTVHEKLAPQARLSSYQEFLLNWISQDRLGKYFRQYIYDWQKYLGQIVEWRNYEASYDVLSLEPASRKQSTYVLQEYFIPIANFDAFTKKMTTILKNNHVNILNISIRHSLPDPGTLLAWARTEVFSFVLYYKQGVTDLDQKDVHEWTRKLIDAALNEGGTYYLPYQIIATNAQFLKSYPRATEFFRLKNRVDPIYKLRNRLLDRYYSVYLTAQLSKAMPWA